MKTIPQRRCVGCMQSFDQNTLIRISYGENGFSVDEKKRSGRGVYLCPNMECINKAEKKNAISRGLKLNISREEIQTLKDKLAVICSDNNGGVMNAK